MAWQLHLVSRTGDLSDDGRQKPTGVYGIYRIKGDTVTVLHEDCGITIEELAQAIKKCKFRFIS